MSSYLNLVLFIISKSSRSVLGFAFDLGSYHLTKRFRPAPEGTAELKRYAEL